MADEDLKDEGYAASLRSKFESLNKQSEEQKKKEKELRQRTKSNTPAFKLKSGKRVDAPPKPKLAPAYVPIPGAKPAAVKGVAPAAPRRPSKSRSSSAGKTKKSEGVADVPPTPAPPTPALPDGVPNGDIAVVGLAVMGMNLIMNMADHGFTVVAYNRTTSKVDDFINGQAKGMSIVGAHSVEDMIGKLKKPRKVMLMVKAGSVVDAFIDSVKGHLEAGDIIIDGGNSHYPDSQRRTKDLGALGIHFIGAGVSGGEEGARTGPSIMPGGAPEAWPAVKPIFQSISAKVDGDPCCDWVGENGAGHYVKMVHNGIEYGDIQLICEAYLLMKDILGMSADEMAATFGEWNKGELDSYLIEITANILAYKDEDGSPLVDKIKDTAGQKGTGKWTVVSALDTGMPVTLIGESVYARMLSAIKDERVAASKILTGPKPDVITDAEEKKAFLEDIRQALYAAKLLSYSQGFMLMREAAKLDGWKLNFGDIALMWRGGCIIRSRFLGEIRRAFTEKPDLENILMDKFFGKAVQDAQASLRRVAFKAVMAGKPIPAMTAALSFYDGYRAKRLPANLLQAQRDYFGAHTYQLLNDSTGAHHHTNWTGTGGTTASSTYNA